MLYKATDSTSYHSSLSEELALRVSHNQYCITNHQEYIKSILRTKYLKEFESVGDTLATLVKADKQFKGSDADEEILCPKSILNMDLIKHLHEKKLATRELSPKPLSDKDNVRLRNLVASTLSNNEFHDHLISN